ncbi:hypothetical protein JCM24511_03156 [Saitozyma sp. JCM 24511]|nr:hypothetical protein JCM24511_03156 [Saitozyma sp. JCM 24511]
MIKATVVQFVERCIIGAAAPRGCHGFRPAVLAILETAFSHCDVLTPAECDLVAQAAGISYEQVRTWFQNKRNRTKHLTPNPKPKALSETKPLKPAGRVASHSELQTRVTPPVIDGRRVASLPNRAKGKAKVEVVDVAPAPVHLDAPAPAGGRKIRSLPKRGQVTSAPAPPAHASTTTDSPALDSAAHLTPTGTSIPSPAPILSLSGSSEASFASASSLDSIPHSGGFTSPLQAPTAGTTTISVPWQSTSTGVLSLMTGSGMDFNFIPPTPVNSTFTGSGWTDSPVDMTHEDFFANLATMAPSTVPQSSLDPSLATAFSQSGEDWSFDPFGNLEGDLASILTSGFSLSGNTTLAGSPQWTVSSSPGEDKVSGYSAGTSTVGLTTPEDVGGGNLEAQKGSGMDMDWSSILGSLGLSEDPLAALESLIAESVANSPGSDISAIAAPLDSVTPVNQQPPEADNNAKQTDKTFEFLSDLTDVSSDSSLIPLSSPGANPVDADPASSIHSASSTSLNLHDEEHNTLQPVIQSVGAVGAANPAEQLLNALQTDPPQPFLCATLSLIHPPSEPSSTSSLNTSLAPSPSPSCATPLAYTASATPSSPYVTPRSDTTALPVSDEDKWISGVLAFDCGTAEWENYADKLVPGGAWDFGGMFGEMEGMQAVG